MINDNQSQSNYYENKRGDAVKGGPQKIRFHRPSHRVYTNLTDTKKAWTVTRFIPKEVSPNTYHEINSPLPRLIGYRIPPCRGEWICDKHERSLDCLILRDLCRNLAISFGRLKHETLFDIYNLTTGLFPSLQRYNKLTFHANFSENCRNKDK